MEQKDRYLMVHTTSHTQVSRHAQLIGQCTYVSMLATITVVDLGLGDSCRGRDIAPLGISRGFMGF